MDASKAISLLLTFATIVSARPSLYYSYPSYYDDLLTGASSYPSALLQNVKSQFHTQDELGQYTYGYNDGQSSKIESRSADGTTHGSYSYIDSNGILQNVNYLADDVNGFQVSGSNFPSAHDNLPISNFPASAESSNYEISASMPEQIVPQVQQLISVPEIQQLVPVAQSESNESKLNSDKAKNEIKKDEETPKKEGDSKTHAKESNTKNNPTKSEATNNEIIQKKINILPKKVPVIPAPAPVAVPNTPVLNYGAAYHISPYQFYNHNNEIPIHAPALPTSYRYSAPHVPEILTPVYSQYHSQDELGQYSYGYSGGPSSKAEIKTLDGVTRGGYSYVDPNGILQKISYISDPINGFRVSGTNLPYPNYSPYYSDYNFNNHISDSEQSTDYSD